MNIQKENEFIKKKYSKKLVGLRISQRLKKLNITQSELEERTGISRKQISLIINNKIDIPKADTIMRIAQALEVSTDYLFGLNDIESNNYNLSEIAKETGLNVDSLKKIQNLYRSHIIRKNTDKSEITKLDTINYIIGHDLFDYVIEDLTKYFELNNYKSSDEYYVIPTNLFDWNIKHDESISKKAIQEYSDVIEANGYEKLLLSNIKIWIDRIKKESIYGDKELLESKRLELIDKLNLENLDSVQENRIKYAIIKIENRLDSLKEEKKHEKL